MHPFSMSHLARIARVARVGVFGLLLATTASVGVSACGQVRRPDGGVGLVPEKSVAPAFSAPDQTGAVRSLGDYAGRPVVLYFYPKDDTPGCTKEACAFRDAWQKLEATGAQVLGVSTDDVASHAAFASAHHLQFPLLADTDGKILKSYGVGSTFGMASRVTFVIDRSGKIARVFPDVDPAIHADQVIDVLRSL